MEAHLYPFSPTNTVLHKNCTAFSAYRLVELYKPTSQKPKVLTAILLEYTVILTMGLYSEGSSTLHIQSIAAYVY